MKVVEEYTDGTQRLATIVEETGIVARGCTGVDETLSEAPMADLKRCTEARCKQRAE